MNLPRIARLPLLAFLGTVLAPLGSCTLPGLESPQYRLTPEFALYELVGSAKMQSEVSGTRVDNPAVRTGELGQNRRDSGDVGGTLSIGEGISTLDISYLHVSLDGNRRTTLTQDFGALRAGDQVFSTLRGDEFRVSYHGKVWEHEWKSGAKFEFAPGLVLAHRDLALRVDQTDRVRTQRLDLHDDVTPYLSARARASYKRFAFQAEYAIDPGIHIGGTYENVLHDLALSIRYAALPDQDVDLIAGWRRFDLDASGSSEDLRFEADWRLQGYFFAVAIGF